MKKKSCLMLAVLLAMLQIIAVFAVVPASAAATYVNPNCGRNYTAYTAATPITIDGEIDSAWENIPWSESFVCAYDGDSTSFNSALNAKFKAVWYYTPDTTDDAAAYELVFLISVTGDIGVAPEAWNGDVFGASVQQGTTNYALGWAGVTDITDGAKADYAYAISDDRASTGSYVIELKAPVLTGDVKVDLYVQDNIGTVAGNTRAFYSWNGYYNGNSSGFVGGNITCANTTAPANPLAGVSVTATNGASIRLDTADNSKSGIRFATTVQVPQGVTIKKTGTLIIPTATLTNKRIVDATFNKDVLTIMGLVEGTDYYDIENVGNGWVTGQDGTWYGTLYNVKNFERAFSGIGYAVVEVNGVEYTVYAEYNSTNHSRSIKGAAQALIDAGTYAENSAEYALLKSFTQAEAVQQ